ncbi:MAG: tetratricopeptide repeat protein [Bacteroidota bacterium]
MSKKAIKKKAVAKKRKSKKPLAVSFWKDPNRLIPLALVLLITAVVFFPATSYDFVNWDDDVNIMDNPNLVRFDWEHIKGIFGSTVMGGYNPLTIFTFALEKHFFDLDPSVFHFNNIVLHLICTFLAYRFLLLLNLSPIAAAFGALLFGVHPMRVESVVWVTERKDVLFGAFYLGALCTYVLSLKAKEAEKRSYFYWTIALFTLSLFSKIQAVALPLSLIGIDYYFKRPLNWKLITEKIPFFALSLFVGLLGIYLLSEAKTLDDSVINYGIFDRLLVGAYSFCVYLVKFIYPYEMSALYPYPKELETIFYFSPIGVLAAVALFYYLFKKEQYALVFGCFFFVVNVIFVLQVLGAGQGFKADRFTYIPYLGLFFMVAWGYDYLSKRYGEYQIMLAGGLGFYCLLFAYISRQQVAVWENGGTLWTNVLKYYKDVALPHGNRGHYYRGLKQFDKAIRDYSEAIRLAPGKAAPYNSLGKTYFDSGNAQQAVFNYNKAIEIEPEEAEFHVNRGAAYGMLNQYDKALADLDEAERIDPEFKNTYLNRSLVHTFIQEYEKALEDHNKYLALNPYNAEIWYERGIIKRRLGNDPEALKDLTEAIRLNDSNGIFFLERAKIYKLQGDVGLARQDAQRAQALGTEVDASLLQ